MVDSHFCLLSRILCSLFCTTILFRFSDYSSRLPTTWVASEASQHGIAISDPTELIEEMGIARGHSELVQ